MARRLSVLPRGRYFRARAEVFALLDAEAKKRARDYECRYTWADVVRYAIRKRLGPAPKGWRRKKTRSGRAGAREGLAPRGRYLRLEAWMFDSLDAAAERQTKATGHRWTWADVARRLASQEVEPPPWGVEAYPERTEVIREFAGMPSKK